MVYVGLQCLLFMKCSKAFINVDLRLTPMRSPVIRPSTRSSRNSKNIGLEGSVGHFTA